MRQTRKKTRGKVQVVQERFTHEEVIREHVYDATPSGTRLVERTLHINEGPAKRVRRHSPPLRATHVAGGTERVPSDGAGGAEASTSSCVLQTRDSTDGEDTPWEGLARRFDEVPESARPWGGAGATAPTVEDRPPPKAKTKPVRPHIKHSA